MISEIPAWAALLGALLSIGVEIWKLRSVRKARAAGVEPEERNEDHLPPFFRGITVLSFIPIAALILAGQALGLYSNEVLLRAEHVDDIFQAEQLTAVCTFVRTIVVLISIVIAVLLIRVIGSYATRMENYFN